MNHSPSRRFITLVLLWLCLALAACKPSPARPASAAPLRVSLNSWVGWGPLFIARERGLFDGLPVELRFIEDAGGRRTAMLSGTVDAYASSVDNLAIDATFGIRGKTVLVFDESAGADGIVAKRDVTWENLRGRRVAVQRGLPGHFLLLAAMADHGLQANDVQILDLDAERAGSGFVGGTLDVAVTWEPWISRTAAMATAHSLANTRDLPGLIVDTLVVRDPVVRGREADVRKLVGGWFRALTWYDAHRDEGNQIIARAYHLQATEVGEMMRGLRFYDQARNRAFLGTPTTPGPIAPLFRRAAGLWQAAGVTTTAVDPTSYIDARFVQ